MSFDLDKPPNHLKAAGRRAWESLTAKFDFGRMS